MFFKKKIVAGFCTKCNSVKQGYQVVFKLGLASGINSFVYLSLFIATKDNKGLEDTAVNLFWMTFILLIGYTIYVNIKSKKICLTCTNELIDD